MNNFWPGFLRASIFFLDANMDVRDNQLYLGGISATALAEAFGTPLYVYEEDVLRRQCRELREAFAEVPTDLHYAMKANSNPSLLEVLRDEGMYIDAVSPFEVRLCLDLGFAPERILFTGNNTSEEDFRYCIDQGVPVNVGSLEELDRFGRLNPGGRVSVRVNPDVGAGHHHHVITGGPHSKFGIYHTEIEAISTLLNTHNLTLIGMQSHIGTGILEGEAMLGAADIILGAAGSFPNLEFVDFGSGFGIPYRPGEKSLDIRELGRQMCTRFMRFTAGQAREVRMKLEPGRFIVAQAGTLLARVTNIQGTPMHRFVGTDTGFNHLIRPTMYGAYHHILNASRVEGEQRPVVVAGNICESGDVFTQNKNGLEDRPLTDPRTGDLLAILDAGAYGMSLASNYNMRARPAEVLVREGDTRLIRRRETFEDLIANYVR